MGEKLREILKNKGDIRRIGVIGMGYVGIPSAVLFADVPHYEMVYGFQRDSGRSGHKIDILNRGQSPLKGVEPGLGELLSKVTAAGKFTCTSDFSKINGLDAVTIAIQTPFRNPKDLIPDFTAMNAGLRQAGKYMNEGTLVVLESTVTPGTTGGFAKKILEEESGMVAGEDFALAHAPERVMVGRLIRNMQEHDRIIGGIDEVSTRRAIELYSPVLTSGKIIPMTATSAEVTKTAENTFRDLQIAAVNELALYCEAMGVNIYDVREGIASLKEEGVTRAILWPGAGVGGHCLTKDTYHLERGAKILGRENLDYPEGRESLYTLARAVNDFMPRHMVNLTVSALKRAGIRIEGAKIAVLGWAFLANSDDARNTPSEVYRDIVLAEGADVAVHDPYVEKYPGVEIIQELDTALDGADVLVIFTAHRQYFSLDPRKTLTISSKDHPVIVDGR
ncbi:MAG TPA: nucleotide sugar dehydrogenase, partial [Methanoregulaceae archaeon]|nr:nucleotide sugar dehydrogenase [Methanoregulaceae archaeon]